MADLERLDIVIGTNADQVSTKLETLEKRITGVNAALVAMKPTGAISQLASELKLLSQSSGDFFKNVSSKQFNSITNNLNKLSSLNSNGIGSSAQALAQMGSTLKSFTSAVNALPKINGNLVTLTVALSRLSGNNVATNIENIGTAFERLVTQLNTLPQINPSLTQFVTSLSKLTSGKISVNANIGGLPSGNATKGLSDILGNGGILSLLGSTLKNIPGVGNVMTVFSFIGASVKEIFGLVKKFIPSLSSIASIIGTIYANVYLIKRVVDGIWKFIEKAMNYGETLNYFNNAFADIGRKSGESWGNAFMSTGQSYIEKMTGYKTNESGFLESTGNTSLGMNPTDIMNYAATFGQMSSSMGVAADNAFTLSEVLVKIGADLASMKNEDFDTMWEKMSSGLQGNAKAWRSLGVDISVASMNEKLAELGFSATADNLTQADKALLRTIILLDRSRYAWSDLAETMNSPANQVRRLKENFEMLGQTIGSIFMPIVAKVLPYINGLVMALQRLAQWFANMLGFKDFDWGFGGGNSLPEDMEDLEDATGGAAKSAKELKKQLLGIDEINNLSTNDKTGGGKGGVGGIDLTDAFNEATSKYLKDWEEKFANIKDTAKEISDIIGTWLDKLKKPLVVTELLFKGAIDRLKKGDFLEAGIDLGKIVGFWADSIAAWIDEIDWSKLGKNVASFIGGALQEATPGILNLIESLLSAAGKLIVNFGATISPFILIAFEEVLARLGEKLVEFLKFSYETNKESLLSFLKFSFESNVISFKACIDNNIESMKKFFQFSYETNLQTIKNIGEAFKNLFLNKLPAFVKSGLASLGKLYVAFFTGIITAVEKLINNIVGGLSGSSIITALSTLTGSSFALSKISLSKDVGNFATGGYPSGSSLFWAGERGAEMLGTVGGKTAVASNGEITGISETIRDTSYAEIELLREQNELLTAILQKPGISRRDIYDSAITEDRIRRKATGRSGFAY